MSKSQGTQLTQKRIMSWPKGANSCIGNVSDAIKRSILPLLVAAVKDDVQAFHLRTPIGQPFVLSQVTTKCGAGHGVWAVRALAILHDKLEYCISLITDFWLESTGYDVDSTTRILAARDQSSIPGAIFFRGTA